MSQEKIEQIKSVLSSGTGASLREFLLAELEYLGSIVNVEKLDDPIAAAVELKATRKAYDKLEAILKVILTLDTSKPTPPPSKVNEYGIE